jgi:hypothetical protein
MIVAVRTRVDSEDLPYIKLEKPTFMVKFERFKVGILTCKFWNYHQRAQFFKLRPQAFGVNGFESP